jgi:lipid-binding SYLF domain-containing protein
MNKHLLALAAGFLSLLLATAPARAAGREIATVAAAAEVVQAFSTIPMQSIPPALLHDAAGVAVIPQVIKAGFLFGGRYGRGVVVVRRPGGWSAPVFVTLAGGSFGLQAGVQSTDIILVFKTTRGLNQLLRGEGKITLGGDISIAAGPVGRHAEAATDGRLQAEIYSYSRSRGLFAGVSLEGAGLLGDPESNAAFASLPAASTTPAVGALLSQLDKLSGPPIQPPPAPVPAPPPTMPAPGR